MLKRRISGKKPAGYGQFPKLRVGKCRSGRREKIFTPPQVQVFDLDHFGPKAWARVAGTD
jgi:hypothetical protein